LRLHGSRLFEGARHSAGLLNGAGLSAGTDRTLQSIVNKVFPEFASPAADAAGNAAASSASAAQKRGREWEQDAAESDSEPENRTVGEREL
jgi:hypothetical protein